jgi:cytochrome c peroxidase
MHDGSLKTLIDIVHFYNHGGNGNPNLDEAIHPLQLTEAEVNDRLSL